MRIVNDVKNRVELFLDLIDGNSEHPSAFFIGRAIFCHNYCFEVMIDLNDFKLLLLNSHARDSSYILEPHEFPMLQEVVREIKARPQFLQEFRSDGGLSGSLVNKKLNDMKIDSAIRGGVLQDKWPNMIDDGSFYIIDGMHRLVAYALFTDLNPEKFPISTYLCTNQIV